MKRVYTIARRAMKEVWQKTPLSEKCLALTALILYGWVVLAVYS